MHFSAPILHFTKFWTPMPTPPPPHFGPSHPYRPLDFAAHHTNIDVHMLCIPAGWGRVSATHDIASLHMSAGWFRHDSHVMTHFFGVWHFAFSVATTTFPTSHRDAAPTVVKTLYLKHLGRSGLTSHGISTLCDTSATPDRHNAVRFASRHSASSQLHSLGIARFVPMVLLIVRLQCFEFFRRLTSSISRHPTMSLHHCPWCLQNLSRPEGSSPNHDPMPSTFPRHSWQCNHNANDPTDDANYDIANLTLWTTSTPTRSMANFDPTLAEQRARH